MFGPEEGSGVSGSSILLHEASPAAIMVTASPIIVEEMIETIVFMNFGLYDSAKLFILFQKSSLKSEITLLHGIKDSTFENCCIFVSETIGIAARLKFFPPIAFRV